jgi:hypothetical protein
VLAILLSLIVWAALLGGIVLTAREHGRDDVRNLAVTAGGWIALIYLFALLQ